MARPGEEEESERRAWDGDGGRDEKAGNTADAGLETFACLTRPSAVHHCAIGVAAAAIQVPAGGDWTSDLIAWGRVGARAGGCI